MIIKKKGAKANQNRVSPPPLPVRKHGANKTEPYFILISRGLRLWTQCRREGMRLVESQSRTGGMGSVWHADYDLPGTVQNGIRSAH